MFFDIDYVLQQVSLSTNTRVQSVNQINYIGSKSMASCFIVLNFK